MTNKTKHFTPKEFEVFKAEFRKWQERFGLQGYKVYFKHKPIDAFAQIVCNEHSDMVVSIVLSTKVEGDDIPLRDPKSSAKHEAIHLLLKRLSARAYERHVRADEIYEAEEELVRRLEGLIK
jgi:hypothetical protein